MAFCLMAFSFIHLKWRWKEFDLILFCFSPGLKYQRCNTPTKRRNSHLTTAISHQAHRWSWTLYRKEDFKKIFITTVTTQQPAFLSFSEKRFKKKRPRWLLVTHPHIHIPTGHRVSFTGTLVERENKRRYEGTRKDWRTWMEMERESEGNQQASRSWCFYTWKKLPLSSAALEQFCCQSLILLIQAGLKVSEGCFQRGGADTRMKKERKRSGTQGETLQQLTLKDFRSIWFTVFSFLLSALTYFKVKVVSSFLS